MKNVLVCNMQILFDMGPGEPKEDALARLKRILNNDGIKVEYYKSEVIPFRDREEQTK